MNEPHYTSLVALQARPLPPGYETATGIIRYGLTNDFMFRAVLEANPIALKGLICSMLHLDLTDVQSVVIQNPFEFGDTVTSKDSILDIKVLMNDQTYINLEMQLLREDFWPERSLSYLCHSFLNLKEGESYNNVRPAIHIGFLDFDLFPDEPEFYATYHLANDITHRIYTGKFALSVLSLKRIELATENDKLFGIDYWAKLFKATTWEELRMIAENNPTLQEAAKTVYKMSDDERIQQLCFAREEHYRILSGYQDALAEAQAALNEKNSILAEKDAYIAELEAKIKQLSNQ